MTEDLQNALNGAQREAVNALKDAVMAVEGQLTQENLATHNSLDLGMQGEDTKITLKDGVELIQPGAKSLARKQTEEATEEQRRRREQYEQDKSTFEHSVMKKVRGLCEIQEDYIKVLHPLYREKFIEGIRKYGTVAAAMKYMKDNHGLKLRGDVLTRITQILPSFKQEVEDAIGEYQAMLHMEMQRRAVEGIDKNIYDKEGNVVKTEKVYSDSLLSKMVDNYNPEYKEAKATNTNKGNVVNVQIIKDFHNYKE